MTILSTIKQVLIVGSFGAFAAIPCRAQDSFPTARFGTIQVIGKHPNPKFTMILFSDSSGIDATSRAVADQAAQAEGQTVIIDTAAYLKSMASDEGECSYLGGELIRLNQSILSNLKTAAYEPPVLGGVRGGAALAYSIFAQKPDEFPGLLTIDFCPKLSTARKLCPSEFVNWAAVDTSNQNILPPANSLSQDWYAFTDRSRQCSTNSDDSFRKMYAKGKAWTAPSFDASVQRDNLNEAFLALNQASDQMFEADEKARGDLPLHLLLPDEPKAKFQIVFYSGDGGWAWIDKGIANEFYSAGIPVLGIDSLRYFWTQRTPAETAKSLTALLKSYHGESDRNQFVLVGFSFGAEILPFVVQELPKELRNTLKAIVLLNPGQTSSFEIHISDWISSDDDDDGPYKITPELRKIASIPILCIYGKDESDSSCVGATGANLKSIGLPGDHHFDGEYNVVGETILKELEGIGLSMDKGPTPTTPDQ